MRRSYRTLALADLRVFDTALLSIAAAAQTVDPELVAAYRKQLRSEGRGWEVGGDLDPRTTSMARLQQMEALGLISSEQRQAELRRRMAPPSLSMTGRRRG